MNKYYIILKMFSISDSMFYFPWVITVMSSSLVLTSFMYIFIDVSPNWYFRIFSIQSININVLRSNLFEDFLLDVFIIYWGIIDSVQFSLSVVSDSLRPHESQHARPPCPSPTPRVHSDSCPSSQWCHPAISSSVVPFSSCPRSLPASQSFPKSQLFAWGGQSTGVSGLASFLPKKSQDWSPSEWTGWISLQSKGLSRVFSNESTLRMRWPKYWSFRFSIIPSKEIPG